MVVVGSVWKKSGACQVEVDSRKVARDDLVSSELCGGRHCDGCCPIRLVCDLPGPRAGMGGGHEQTGAQEVPLRWIPQLPELTGCSGSKTRRSGAENGVTKEYWCETGSVD